MAIKKVDLQIKGMTCTSRAQRVEKALKKTEGVQGAHVNLATEKAAISYDPIQVTPENECSGPGASLFLLSAG